ncbi:MAG: shikimate kinase [Actinobacteria bacterium]|nr:MAG: shikimate kinase [Actinomycetota bacterium]
MVSPLDRHVALIGFMGAGKSTLGRELARLTSRPFVDTDEEIERRFGPIAELFERNEPDFRRIEEQVVAEALAGPTAVIALGGGAVLSEATQTRLASTAFVAYVEGDVDTAWERVKDSGRPLAHDREEFAKLFAERDEIYESTADGWGRTTEGLLLASLGIAGWKLGLTPAVAGAAIVADERVLQLHELHVTPGTSTHLVPSGELRGRNSPSRSLMVGNTDDARRHGRRSNWRKDGDQHRQREEPRRCLSLSKASLARSIFARDASG